MKSLKFLSLATFAFASVVLTSCNKDVEDRLPGDWTFVEVESWTNTITSTGAVIATDDTDSETGKVTFNEDGTGTWTDQDGDKKTITWSSSDTQVIINGDEVWTIKTNEKESQEWEMNYTSTTTSGSTSTVYTKKTSIKLSK